ncbi:electron transport complex subunit RsxC [Edaphovirga cremea]|uniref:electron transport complex subunit RsxC n=1 Tax=Edaphovirga cremea TaxID=2267246 RepID=UPI000DEEB39C|nr:electron transport complex subunit RsxC [Edaphovirga cremea]
MFNLFAALKKDKIWDFAGGIHPPEMKTQSSRVPLRIAPLAEKFIIPLQQHLGPEGELCVKAGDRVLKGQPLTIGRGRTLPVHAPTSGTIVAIAPHITAHPSGLQELCVHIEPDGDDRWCQRDPVADYHQMEPAELNERIHLAGIAGLGGAGFPTASKLQGGLQSVKTLILNAAECEPYITADDRLMQEHAAEIITGTRILCHLLNPERVIIGIEDNKPEAIAALKRALQQDGEAGVKFELKVVPTKYPSGGAKQLTRILTGLEVPHGKHSSSIGVLMQNVGTVYAITRAIIHGEPLIERVVTLTGESLKQPGNLWARIGTPVEHLLAYAGFQPSADHMVVMGGPLMGFTLPSLNVPIVKISNCILAPSASEMGQPEPEEACIRCSQCADACPAGLLPQQLYWFSRGEEHEKARNHNLFDCIECGACAYVCPSNIPLVQYYRQEKAEIKAIDLEGQRAAEAKARFEARQARLEREKVAREERHKQAAVKLTDSQHGQVQAALARVRTRKADEAIEVINGQQPDNSAVIAEREARKAQARDRRAAQPTENESVSEAQADAETSAHQEDPRKAALAAAIARAKARKATTNADAAPPKDIAQAANDAVEPDIAVDERQAAVAAAIARVKARKAAQSLTPQSLTQPDSANDQPQETAIAAGAEYLSSQESDPRKAAVAAAIARAKARKAAQAAMSDED